MEIGESIARATATAGGAVVFARTTVVIALCSLLFAGIPLSPTSATPRQSRWWWACWAPSRCSRRCSGRLARASTLSGQARRTHPDDHQPHGWARWARGVAARPWRSLIASAAVLVALAIPVLHLELGQSDTGALPKSTTARQAYDAVGKAFGEGANGPLLVSTKLGKKAAPDQDNLNKINDQQKKLDQQKQQIEQQAQLQGDAGPGQGPGEQADLLAAGQAQQPAQKGGEPGDRPQTHRPL